MIGYASEHKPRALKPVARIVLSALLGLVLVGAVGVAYADYAIDWHTIDGGGEMSSTGGTYELSGTIGQPDAGELTGGTHTLTGGFWFGCVPGDCDCDGDVDLHDFASFPDCMAGPDATPDPTPPTTIGDCLESFDFDGDDDVDLIDFAGFQLAYTG